MNFNAVNVIMFGVGAILVYSAIKDKNPKDVVTNAFANQSVAPSGKNKSKKGASTGDGNNAPSSGHSSKSPGQNATAPVVTSN